MANYLEFWSYFLKKAQPVISLYQGVSPKNKSYLYTKKATFEKYCIAFNTKDKIAWVERCFQEQGPDGVNESNRKFDHFFFQKNVIEQQYKGVMEWKQLKEKKRSRILSELVPFDIENQDSWDETIDQLLDKMGRFIPVIEDAYKGLSAFTTEKAAVIKRTGDYRPIKNDAEKAIGQIFPQSDVATILDQIEKNCIEAGQILVSNWRTITDRNIKEYWFQ